ncbi:hypothetical protein [Nostoc sp. PCC 9305]|uniref:hypothetical protein n=1 Tax=Nostoc sp. PCC 9305 TaxID=296636 RepID=UPI0039C646D4
MQKLLLQDVGKRLKVTGFGKIPYFYLLLFSEQFSHVTTALCLLAKSNEQQVYYQRSHNRMVGNGGSLSNFNN